MKDLSKVTEKSKIKFSIEYQLILRCVIVITCTVLFNYILNALFIENFYIENRKDQLIKAGDLMNEYVFDISGYEDSVVFTKNMTKLCNTYNINYIITDSSSNIIKTSVDNPEQFNKLLRQMLFMANSDNVSIMESNKRYTLGRFIDSSSKLEYIGIWGYLPDGNFYMLRSAIEGIHDSVILFNNFLIQVGLIAVIVACIVIYPVAKSITSPIKKLTRQSEKMANLDFSEKYESRHLNEVDVLGENFNVMSDKLENAFEQLKHANSKLQADVDQKTKVDNMRKEFISNVSHELKTPIAIISGYAEGLRDGISDDPESMQFYCDVIVDEANKMNKMVKQLMKLNSLEFGGDNLEISCFGLEVLVKNCIESVGIIREKEGVNIEYIYDENVLVEADEYQIEEVFRNYLNNAFNHCDYNKKIAVTVKRVNNKARCSVFNTGKNIPEDALGNIWEKFYKVDKARTREYGGSGIGLSIVKAVMELHHGNYGVINRENGVEFWFELDTK